MAEMRPDFKMAYAIANELLLTSYTITTLPADIHGHLKKETDIQLYSYETAKRKFGIDLSFFGSEDALITAVRGKHILFYRKNTDQHRMRWSLGHESGHFYLEHNMDLGSINKEQYDLQEIEANFFAAQVLMPDYVIWELINRGEVLTKDNLIKWFNVSNEAAMKRIETLNKQADYRYRLFDNNDKESMLLKFEPFIESISPRKPWQTSFEDEEMMQKERDSWFY